jgi:hypothetical protein
MAEPFALAPGTVNQTNPFSATPNRSRAVFALVESVWVFKAGPI